MNKVKSLHGHVKESLKKVQEKPWAEPLGEALEVSAKIVEGLGNFVPGANMIGGALSFGATLLNPQPTLKDLQQQLSEIKKDLESPTLGAVAVRLLEKEKKDILEAIEKENKEVMDAMQTMFDKVSTSNTELTKDMADIKDRVNQILLHVVEARFKVRIIILGISVSLVFLLQDGIDLIDAAYEDFISDPSKKKYQELTNYIKELRTNKTMYLAPKRIQEYLTHIHQEGGFDMCHAVMSYVFIVLAKYLQMVVAYDIFNNDFDRVTKQFEDFNTQYEELVKVFSKVTSNEFEPGRELEALFKEAGQSAECQLNNFLSKAGLSGLEPIFREEQMTLDNVLKMDNDQMKFFKITKVQDRLDLMKAIKEYSPKGTKEIFDKGNAYFKLISAKI